MIVDCDRCAIRGVGCADCVISVLLDAPPVVEFAEPELRALDTLADAGLVPRLRLVPLDTPTQRDAEESDETPDPTRPSAERLTSSARRQRRQVS